MAVCSAITHNGSRCASPAADDGSGVCSHHARMARLLALAPKTSANDNTPVAASPSIPVANGSNGVLPHAPVVSSRPASFDMKDTQRELYSIQKQSQHAPASLLRGGSHSAGTIASKQTPAAPLGTGMLPNEGVLAAVNSSFMFPTTVGLPAIPGTLFITNYRLRFEPIQAALRSPGHFHALLDDALVGIPRACVGKLTYPQAANATRSKYESAVPTQLVIKFKDLRAWTLGGDINTLMMTLNRHVFIDSPLSLFAFTAGISPAHAHRELEGHHIYNLVADFTRMGVDLVNGPFRVTEMNANYAMCPTYPPQIVVPASMSDHEIASVADFRSKGRLPICCFVHPRNSASIWRCAQPKRGILNAQNPADDRYLAYIGYSNRHQKKIWIADCRPELNARVNKLTGGGTESSSLQHASVSFLNIANIHAMRDSIESIRALVATGNADLDFVWNTRVEDTKWLSHVRLVLSAAIRVAEAVGNKGTTVLVHCSDGWDRTGQLCALSQMLLDKHYRTIVGFMEIIEKEWIRVGHKFHDRVGPGRSEHEEQSPVFLQFLDCVWQLWRQYPTYFEFNGKLLECIADAIFSGRYGTFLGNCDRERTAWSLRTRTASLWTHVLDHKATYQNPFYRPQTETTLLPPVSSVLRQVTLWSEYYFRSATLPATPMGNPCPPVFGNDGAATSKTNHDDLVAAMAAAMRRIQALEEELRDAQQSRSAVNHHGHSHQQIAQAAVQSPPAISPSPPPVLSQPASPPVSTPIVMPPSAPIPATLHAPNTTFLRPPSVESLHLAGVTTSETPSVNGSLSNGSSASNGALLSTWSCAICSKLNVSESIKCVVCGRPPPASSVVV